MNRVREWLADVQGAFGAWLLSNARSGEACAVLTDLEAELLTAMHGDGPDDVGVRVEVRLDVAVPKLLDNPDEVRAQVLRQLAERMRAEPWVPEAVVDGTTSRLYSFSLWRRA